VSFVRNLSVVLGLVGLCGATSACGTETPGGAGTGGVTNGSGGAANTGGTATTGGAVTTGGTQTTTGGRAAGGSTAVTGGTASGGVATGGSATGGKATGGTATGGVATGGTATGGRASGGTTGTGGSQGTCGTAKPIGFATLNGGTTGGLGGQTVTVTTFADLKSYAESATAYIIMVQGTISNGASGGQVKIKSNKSIIGIGSTAYLSGIGLDISGSNSNIIIQNLRLSLTGVTTPSAVNGGDVIGISGTSKNIWIDHCELFSENPDVQTNIDLYDGLIDIKAQTGFITISWCYLHDHHKGGLVGAADDDLFSDRKVTLHHNYYNKVKLRIPMYRGAVGHFFNNYIVGATDATEIRAGTCVRVEKNYYEALHYSIYTPSDSPGSTERIDNIEVSRTSRAYPANCTADIPYSYPDALTSTTNDVKTVVPQCAGVGKI
jgi:pectate lyase